MTLLIMRQVCEGLLTAHERDIVHRDVKPSNILLDGRGNACIADFGLAQTNTTSNDTSVLKDNHPGTAEYMPPEQRPGNLMPVRASADVYALGCVLFEMLTGRQYYHRTVGTSVKTLRPEVPVWLDKVIVKALSPKAEDRYLNAKELLEALEQGGGGPKKKPWIWVAAGGGQALILLFIIGGLSGWFSPKASTASPVSTEVPAKTETSVIATETHAATPASTEALVFGIGSTKVSEIDGMTMVYVPAGEFTMGSPDGVGNSDEHPQHQVYLDAYWIDQTEVTNVMFAKFITETNYQTDAEILGESRVFAGSVRETIIGANWKHPQGSNSNLDGIDDHPVVQVSWNDASAYCEWAERTLPTEAQWEKAARGVNGLTYPWGEEKAAGNLANLADSNLNVPWAENQISDGYQFSAPVGSYEDGKSPYGAYDMAGNVWEWVADWYDETYYQNRVLVDMQGPSSGEFRVLRGGSWYLHSSEIRTAIRGFNSPSKSGNYIGFRCAMSASEIP